MNLKLKKALKITGITLGSLLGLVIIMVALVCILVFTSPGLTSVARKAIDKYSPARAKIDDVDLTLVKSYPFLGFRLNGLVIYDDMEDSPSDTLAAVDKFTVTVDFKTLYKERKIILTNLYIDGILANVFTAADGRSNLDVFGTSDEKEEKEQDDSGINIYADLQRISIGNVNASYIDLTSGTSAGINNLDIELKGLLNYDSLEAKTGIKLESVNASIKNDSTDLSAVLKGLKIDGELQKYGDDVSGNLTLNLKETSASTGDMNANIDGFKFIVDELTCSLGKDGLKDLVAGLKLNISDVDITSTAMAASTGAIALNAPKAVYTGDSINLSEFTFDTRNITVQLEDSVGTLTKADVEKILIGLDGGLKFDMNSVNTVLSLALQGTKFEMGGESPLNVAADNLTLIADAGIRNEDITLNSELSIPSVKVLMDGDTYVPGWSLALTLPVETNKSITRFAIREGAKVNIDGQRIGFNANGTLGGARKVSGRVRVKTIDDLDIDRLISMIPDKFKDALDGIDVHGIVGLDVNVKGGMGNNGPILDNAIANVSLQEFDACLNDSLKAASGKLTANVTYPSVIAVDRDRKSADVAVSATDLNVSMVDSTTINASIDGLDISASVVGLTDSINQMNVIADINAKKLQADMDTIFGTLDNTTISLTMAPADNSIAMAADIAFEGLAAVMGSALSATLGSSSIHAIAQYDETKEDILLKWNPHLKMTLEDGQLDMLAEPVCLPKMDVDFSLGRFNINDCRVEIDNSDIMLWGDIYNIGAYLDGSGLLTGELYLESDHVDINKLISITGNSSEADEQVAEQVVSDIESGADTISAEPIMIPKGIDLTLYTNLSEVNFNEHTFNNVGGDVTIRDGVIILQELGFSSNAAEMQLTAIYRTPSVENRFMELDFHLLDIEIDELIDLIPAVDSVVPMLKSFSGKAQFHFAAETYLEPDVKLHGDFYPIMYSLMGAAAIEGKDLVVLDNDVFNGIKKKLFMGKNARNVIDSLDVEIQVLDEKVDLYPTRIVMGNYEAIVSGRHNIDQNLSCNYNVSLVKCPLPIRLGVTVSGPLGEIAKFPLRHIKLGLAKYEKLYNPGKQGKAEETILRMKSDILNTLRGNVR